MSESDAFLVGYPAAGVVESEALVALVDRAAILSTEQQLHLSALHADDSWSIDAATQVFTFTAADDSVLTVRAHLLGSAAPGPMSWLWAWVNSNGFPEAFFARSVDVRARGTADSVPELTTDELPLTEGLPLRLTIAAKAITGLTAHYSPPVGGGTRIWLLLEDDRLALPAPTVLRTMEALRATLDTVLLTDPMAALEAYAEQRGIPLSAAKTENDDPVDAQARRLELPDGHLVVVFDGQRRIVRLQAEVEASSDGEAPAAGEGGVQDRAVEEPQPSPEVRVAPTPEPGPSPVPLPSDAAGTEKKGLLGRLFGRRS